ncbi:adenosylmethionine--8-amino-7-oxononanoate transaminase [Rubinisphaera sp. JC750]|uniref:adenosylmethionine--8-amino-7-oxononanoate transaminase n=1 Tax=Rubinisphaera sp. JC750 TaxID=2898658 RepID=UPI001F010C91|nr:adenosylmethionine--8-amino-7-oxononanoate transaminase [Rubinisphaera sp. JC750]
MTSSTAIQPSVEQLYAWDGRDVWHPFTPMTVHAREKPPIITSGEGFYVFDVEGRKYLDGISSLWCNVHGHRVPELDDAIRSQLDEIAHTTLLGTSTPTAIELAHKIVEQTPEGLNHVFYSDAGSTAVEAALKMVVQYHYQKEGGRDSGKPRRTVFVRVAEAYHGDTIGSVSVGRIDAFHGSLEGMLFDTLTVPCPVAYRVPEGFTADSWLEHCYAEVERLIAENADRIAGFIMEPLVQGAAGVMVHPEGYLRHVREVTAKHGIPLIADEVAVGFGKTGTLFACEQEQVTPDILCLAKGITGGYLPLAATVTTSEIFDAFLGEPSEGKTFFHGHTYTGNALACAVALASWKLIEDRNVLDNVASATDYLQQRMSEVAEHPHVGEVRQKGMMIGIELVLDKEAKTPYPAEQRIGHQVTLAARKRGLIIRPLGNVVILMPAIAMPQEELAELCDKTLAAIREACPA